MYKDTERSHTLRASVILPVQTIEPESPLKRRAFLLNNPELAWKNTCNL